MNCGSLLRLPVPAPASLDQAVAHYRSTKQDVYGYGIACRADAIAPDNSVVNMRAAAESMIPPTLIARDGDIRQRERATIV